MEIAHFGALIYITNQTKLGVPNGYDYNVKTTRTLYYVPLTMSFSYRSDGLSLFIDEAVDN